LFTRSGSSFVRVAGVLLAAVTVLAACSHGGGGVTAPTIPPASADPSGWSKTSVAAVHALADQIGKRVPGGCTEFAIANRAAYIKGLKRVGKPIPDAVGKCTALTEDLEISMFPSAAVRDDFVDNRRNKICEISKRNNVGLPGLYWVVGGNWSIQPDSEGVGRRVANAIHAKYEATGCTGTNPGWDPTAVTTLEQTASELHAKHEGCADMQLQDRDLVAKTVPYNQIGTPAAQANCTLPGGATIVLSAYNTPADKTAELIKGELSRECVQSNTRIVRIGNVAMFAGAGSTADSLKNAIGGSLSPMDCKIFG
jgi:hypothetical protein